MKHIILHYSTFTEEFNLLGKIVIGAVTGFVIAGCIAMTIGLIIQGAPAVIGYAQ
jgi:hypothetical protein